MQVYKLLEPRREFTTAKTGVVNCSVWTVNFHVYMLLDNKEHNNDKNNILQWDPLKMEPKELQDMDWVIHSTNVPLYL
jgi:hypothetical protein